MQQKLGQNYAISQREAFLKDNCDAVVEKGYMKRLTSEELQANKEQLSEVAIQINDIELEKKEVSIEYKKRLDPLTTERTEILQALKQKAIYKNEQCYKFVDPEEKMVGFYNVEGDLIESRPATSDELQGTIFQIGRKTGTNN